MIDHDVGRDPTDSPPPHGGNMYACTRRPYGLPFRFLPPPRPPSRIYSTRHLHTGISAHIRCIAHLFPVISNMSRAVHFYPPNGFPPTNHGDSEEMKV